MHVREITWQGGRGLVAIFAKGDELMAGLRKLAEDHMITGATLSGVGAFERATLGFYDRTTMQYHKIPISEQVEVLSLAGNIALSEGKPKIHAHVVVGMIDGTAKGGHILEAYVWPTLEIMIAQTPATLQRHHDPETGLALLNKPG